MPDKQRASAAELVRNFGFWQETALHAPVYITHHKRDRLVLSSIEDFQAATNGAARPAPAEYRDQADGSELARLKAEHWALLDNMSDGYMVIDESMTIIAANRSAETFFSTGRNQLDGRTLESLFPDRNSFVVREYIARALRTRESVTFENESTAYPGRHFRIKLYPHPSGIAMMAQNLTELNHLAGLAHEGESLRIALERHPDVGHAQTDARGRFTYCDDTIRYWTNFTADELLSVRLSDIVIVSDRHRLNAAREEVVASQVPTADLFSVMVKNFAERQMCFAMAPILAGQATIGVNIVITMAVAA